MQQFDYKKSLNWFSLSVIKVGKYFFSPA